MALKNEITDNWEPNQQRGCPGIPEQDKKVVKGSVLAALILAANVSKIQ